MYHKSAITVVIAIALLLPGLGCGPNCQKLLSTKKPEDIAKEDTARINGLVERRKAAMETAKDGNQYVIEDAKQTVTACEMAVEFQYRIIKLQEEGNPIIEKNIGKINEARCFLDDVLESKGKLIGTGKGALISGSNARKIRAYHEELGGIFGIEGTVSERRLVTIYEEGLKIDKAKEESKKEGPDEGEDGAEVGAEAESVDELGEDVGASDADSSEDASGEEGEGDGDGDDSMGSF